MKTLIATALLAGCVGAVGAAPADAAVHENVMRIGSNVVVRSTYDTGSHRLCVKAHSGSFGRGVVLIRTITQTGPTYKHRFRDVSGGGARCLTFFGAEVGPTIRVDADYHSGAEGLSDHWYVRSPD